VLPYILNSLGLVPLELKLSLMQAPLSRRELASRHRRSPGNGGHAARDLWPI
jgi:hypothetical protein